MTHNWTVDGRGGRYGIQQLESARPQTPLTIICLGPRQWYICMRMSYVLTLLLTIPALAAFAFFRFLLRYSRRHAPISFA